MKNIEEYELYNIRYDCQTIIEIIRNNIDTDPVFFMAIIQYFALFCCERGDYLADRKNDLSYKVDPKIREVRNTLKLFSERYGRIKKAIQNTDDQQDEQFRKLVKLQFIIDSNLYDNLGIYLDENNNIVGNTYLIHYAIGYYNEKIISKKILELSTKINTILRAEHDSIKSSQKIAIDAFSYAKEIKYIDVNSNSNTLFANSFSKELNLILLCALSQVGAVTYLFSEVLSSDNLWLFRLKFIVVYYLLKTLDNIRLMDKEGLFDNQSENRVIINLLKTKEQIVNPDFRSCMMHYKLNNNGIDLIKPHFINDNIPFFGLVESCYNGMSFSDLNEKIDDALKEIEKFLIQFFLIDEKDIREF